MPAPDTTTLDLDRLAVDLERRDHATTPAQAAAIVDLARARGLATPSVDVLQDPSAPAVTRDRALLVLAARLRATGRDGALAAAA